jgi:hypothetical protein
MKLTNIQNAIKKFIWRSFRDSVDSSIITERLILILIAESIDIPVNHSMSIVWYRDNIFFKSSYESR